MGSESINYQKVSKGELRGWVRKDICDSLPASFFDDPVSFVRATEGKVIHESKWRWAGIFRLPNGGRVFLKRDRTKGFMESVKYLLIPSRERREWILSYRLRGKNLKIPKPFGWMERVRGGFVRESYYLSEAIGMGVSFMDDSARRKSRSSIFGLAQAIRKIHDAGLDHPDLHGGNFLWDGESLLLTDLHGVRIVKAVSLNQRLWNLSHLLHSLRHDWGEAEQIQFVDHYFAPDSIPIPEKENLIQRIYSIMYRLQQRQWQSRTKRCLKESTEFSIQKERGTRYYRRRDFPLDDLKRMVEEHRTLAREKASCLVKYSSGVIVSILDDGVGKICIKQFCYPSFWRRMKEHFRRSKGLKAWIAANGLRVRGIPSLKPLGLMEKKGLFGVEESFFLMETAAPDREMDRYVLRGFKDFIEKRLFIQTFAQWLSIFHQKNLFHKDMKTCNILVSEKAESWDFHLLDFEDISLDKTVNHRGLFKNLLQLHLSTPRVMTRADRLRFFREYVRFNPIVQDQKAFLRKLVEASRGRSLVYVSPEGVIIENM